MPEKYKDEIEEILRRSGEAAPVENASERPVAPEDSPELQDALNQGPQPRRRRFAFSPGKIMLGGLVIFLIAAGLYAIASATFGLIREPIEPVRKSREPIRSYLAGGFRLLKDDDDYRRLFILRYLWATAMMGTSFYVPFAISDLGMNIVYIGLFVSVSQVSSVLSNALWARIGDRKGNRALLIYGTYFLAGSLLIPLSTPLVLDLTIRPLAFLGIPFSISTQVLYFSLTFLCNGFANSGMFTGRMALVLDLAPADRRPTYTSFMNTLGVPQGLLPILGGFLAAWLSYRDMF